MDYADLYDILKEAAARAVDPTLPQKVRDDSAETVDLVRQRITHEGIDVATLAKMASRDRHIRGY